ncbi:MAG: DUF445 family protein [Deltaproteobacteria bacterium]|nr:DUF445 family protein [Deltaproteobacteria bacterium]
MDLTTLTHGFAGWSWLVPPLAGAVIGWFTNYLAIRMLFRPLEKVYVFGLPLPLTPGIIPARRRDLAKRIAEMVGEHLLTEEVIAERLRSQAVDDALYRWVAARVGNLLEYDCGPFTTLIPETLRPLWKQWWGQGWRPVYGLVDRLLEAPELELLLKAGLAELGQELGRRSLLELLDRRQQARLRHGLRKLLQQGLREPDFRRRLVLELDRLAQRLATSETPLGELLPADLQTALLGELHRELPDLLVTFSRLLHDPAFRAGLKRKILAIINAYIGNMGFWQRLVTSLALSDEEIAKKVDRLVDEVADDFARSLRQPEWQEKVFNLLAGRFADLMALSPARIAGRLSFARVSRGWIFIRRRLLRALEQPRLTRRLADLAEALFVSLGRRPLGELLGDLGVVSGSGDDLAEKLAGVVAARLRSGRVKRRLSLVLAARVTFWLENQPLGRLSRWLPAAFVDPLVVYGHSRLKGWLADELPGLSADFAVRKVVEERIDELPILKVEELLLGIMREHFFYINLFGALVGALIGLIQVLLMRFV